jgi:hypothetical protein
MKLQLSYNDESFKKKLEDLINEKYPFVEFESFNENLFKEKKKAYKLKGGYSARMTPFALLTEDKLVKAFYTEAQQCTIENILNTINEWTLTNGF